MPKTRRGTGRWRALSRRAAWPARAASPDLDQAVDPFGIRLYGGGGRGEMAVRSEHQREVVGDGARRHGDFPRDRRV
jgi:hypothetical protein